MLVPRSGTVVRKVELDFTGLQPPGALDVDALILPDRTDGRWLSKVVSFTGQPRVVFCFDRGKSTETVRGSFDTLELALSNHAHTAGSSIAGDFLATSSEAPCGVWAGTTKVTSSFTNSAGTTSITITADVVFEFDQEAASMSSEFEIPYRVRSGSYQFDHLFQSVGRTPTCRTIQRAAGTMHSAPLGDPNPGATFANLTFYTDYSPVMYTGSGTTMATVTSTTNCNSANVDVTTTSIESVPWFATNGPFELSSDGLRASGSVDSPNGQASVSHFEWAFTKQEE